ncbi:3-hydroxy-3-methylglutaryl-CoA reductase [Alkalilimnicola ehrlichii]|uniref:hydroxymethylglutaryl-CoA reductase (NADPH) n=1 Tax=Alkalilimnicola ehrlichii TaxID=351052 RepID=A0A3E0WL96_9GAMM|nr:hydroxymethylglutaryl-CoA reductase [Alkalilimnicola ehrlichii]RFA25578.1 3-hydroxy-3-methylglutaryl-CoA reductase [Alkalilimnicola ehrlichii]RFA32705.1 3-hydroxy-3-methylglutaryl-CoA reductase [Alkalilimnicola ehrlichii]
MATDHYQLNDYLSQLLDIYPIEQLYDRLENRRHPAKARLPLSPRCKPALVERRWQAVGGDAKVREQLLDTQTRADMEAYRANIENFIGTVKVPVGIAGPLRVNGLFAQGDYFLPLATTEAALVASYNRGAQLITEAGGCAAMLLDEGVSRAPGFAFANLREAGEFAAWAVSSLNELRQVGESTTRHGKLKNLRLTVEGNHVYLHFEFATGDAAGQNMVTIATEAICAHILAHAPVKPQYHFIEANLSGDKKASAQSFLGVRGRKATAEIHLPRELVEKRLHTTPESMVDYWRMSALGGVMSGTIGVHGHYANGLAALYIACGQDAACVAESAVGVTRFELTDDGLYAAVTLPNLIVGSVGGGTGLPSQAACLSILGLKGPGKARALAEVAAGLTLGGELSIIGALCAGHFSRAHKVLARDRKDS